jgi:hypothetical protein
MIEFQFFDGCPNAKSTYENLIEVVKELNINRAEIRIVKVPDSESAERTNFQGSPTILVNGIDIYTELKPMGYNYSCRVYNFNNNQTGILSKQFIKERIQKHA